MSSTLPDKQQSSTDRRGIVKKILVVAGSSGGHVFPAIAFLENLKDRHKDIEALLVVPRKCLAFDILSDDYRVVTISTTPLGLRLDLKNILGLFHFIRGFLQSLEIFLSFRPEAVIGFGGLDSIPLILLAWMARVKTVIHEQNCLPGRANRLLALFCDRIAVSFPETRGFLRKKNEHIVMTGNPIRPSLKRMTKEKASDFFGMEKEKFTMLVMGGSQGSHRINICFLEAVAGLCEESNFQIIHISGDLDFPLLESEYEKLKCPVKLFRFLKEMQYAYSLADLVICRAGATTITELTSFKIPSIIIPYPFAYRHQFYNAAKLQNEGCALIVKDEELEGGVLRRQLKEWINAPEKLEQMRQSYEKIQEFPSADLLIDLAVTLN